MFFKRFSRLALRGLMGPAFMLALSSCLPVGEKPSGTPKTETKIGEEAKCLSGLLPTLQDFVKGEAETDKVVGLWTCFDDALGLFERRVRGSDPNSYSSREVARFFEDYFLDDNIKINDRLLVEVMRFKQLVAGGANSKMTRSELARLRDFARFMRDLSAELNPQMKILTMNWAVTGNDKFEEDFEKFEVAKTVSLKVIEDVAGWIEPNGQTYRIENFVVLMKELQRLAGKEWLATGAIEKMIPLLSKLKGALTGTEESVIEPADWRRFGRLGARSYFQYLRYYYFFEQNPHRKEDPELFLVFRSLDDLFSVVSDVLQEKTGQKLVRKEILTVLDSVSNVFPSFKVSEPLLNEILKLKALFLGGSAEELTPADLVRARAKLDPFRQITNLLLNNAKVFEFKWDPKSMPEDAARAHFDGAESALLKIAQLVGPIFEADYDLDSLLSLVKAYEASFPTADKDASASKRMAQLMPIVIAGKQLILATEGSVVKKQDFPYLLGVLARSAARVYEYKYFLEDKSIFRLPVAFEGWIKPLADLSQHIFEARGRGTVKILSEGDIRSLVRTLDKGGYLTGLYSRANLEMLMPILTRRFFPPPEDRLSGDLENGIGPRAIKNILSEVKIWIDVQVNLNAALASDPKLLHGKLISEFENNKGTGDKELLRLINSRMPLALDQKNRLYISTGGQVPYTEQSVDTLNLVRSALRWIIRSYGSNSSQVRQLAGLNQQQFTRIYKDFKPLAVQMDWLAESNNSFDTSRFMEGNLFTGFSDGDDFLDFSEAGNLTSMIVSGLNLHSMFKTRLLAECRIRGAKVLSVGAECAVEVIRQEAPRVLASMPGMVQLLKGDRRQVTVFLMQVLKSAGWNPNKEGIAPLSDVALMPHVLQYIESLFKRWDRDGNGILDRQEAMQAEPMFRPLIKKVSNLEEVNWLRAVFAYILVKGKPPETFWEKFQFTTGWVDQDDTWQIEANRVMIGQILGFIADSVRNNITINVREELDQVER